MTDRSTAERYQHIRQQLILIQTEMERLNLWQTSPPPPEAFDSELPFHADTMEFDHWLQWVMLARFHALLDAEVPLPTNCAITPMAELAWQEGGDHRRHLLGLLADLDALFEN
jgi:uncharacterized protein YqcC (DUF446 family)